MSKYKIITTNNKLIVYKRINILFYKYWKVIVEQYFDVEEKWKVLDYYSEIYNCNNN